VGLDEAAPQEFAETPEDAALRAAVRDYCRRSWDETTVRDVSEGRRAVPANSWVSLAEQLGVLGLVVPGRWGGSSAGLGEAAIVAGELGAALVPLPYLSSVLAARLLLAAGDESACSDLLPGLCAGTRIFAVAGSDAAGRWAAAPSAAAAQGARGWLLHGTSASVVDAAHASDLLVVADLDGPTLFHVEAGAPGVARSPVPTMDLTRTQADVRLDGAAARLIGAPGQARDPLARASDAVTVLLAAELAGVAATMVDSAVSYARERIQFGRPIGSFQAVKHRCADMMIELELSRSVAVHAAWTHDHGGDDPELAASLAQVVAAGAARKITAGAVQVYGGIAFTWEHRAHLYYKRAVADAALWGGRCHRRRLAGLAL
jgi:alkylation response protein AidB-like acyl-CoA dehydrogenase